MLFLIIVWLAFAYVCYETAKEKGLNQDIWGVLGIVFGVFALIILVLIPKKK